MQIRSTVVFMRETPSGKKVKMTTITTNMLRVELQDAVQRVYGYCSPFTNKAWVVGIQLEAEALEWDLQGVEMDAVENIIKLAQSHQYLDGHNWSDMAKAVNEGVIDVARVLKARLRKAGA